MNVRRTRLVRLWTLLWIGLALFVVANHVKAAPDLSVGIEYAPPGNSVNIPVVFDNNGQVVALQFDVQYDSAQLTSQDVVSGDMLSAANSVVSRQYSSDVRRVVILPSHDNAVLVSGEVVKLPFVISPSAVPGNIPLMINNITLTNAQSINVPIDAVLEGSVQVSNVAPISNNGSIEVVQNQSYAGTLNASDSDPLTYSIVSNPVNGAVLINNASTGAFSYTPNVNFSGTDSFTFKANDGELDSNIATVNVNVTLDSSAYPDLLITNIITPSQAGVGGTISTDMVVENQGGENAGTFHSYYYLSTDDIITSSDQYLTAVYHYAGLASGANQTQNRSLTIPATVTPGVYYIGVLTDHFNAVSESNENNNSANAMIAVVTSDIDASVSSVMANQSNVVSGESINITAMLKNNGSHDIVSGATTVNYYLSNDAAISSTDILLGSRSVGGVAAGATVGYILSSALNVDPGTYYLGAIVDEPNALAESDENNNSLAGATITVVSGPDLLVTSFTVPSESGASSWITASATVANQGDADAGSTVLSHYFLSTDATITTDDVYLNYSNNTGFVAGASQNINTSLFIPNGTVPGSYYIGILTDRQNSVSESNETNNTASAPFTVIVNGDDATVTSVVPSVQTLTSGTSMSITATIENLGNYGMPAGTVDVDFYFSADTSIDTSDTFLGRRTTQTNLNGGDSLSLTLGTTVNIEPGTYYVGAIADATARHNEIDETNNTLAGGTVTVTQGADLVVSSLSPPSLGTAGSMVVASVNIANQGGGDSGDFYSFYYLSSDPTITTSDQYLNYVYHSTGLAVGSSLSANAYLLIPAGTAPGNYYIGVLADKQNFVKESDESNNTFAVPFEVQ